MMSTDWQKMYFEKKVPLYDALYGYMGDGKAVPQLLVREYLQAINDYQDGKSDIVESLGFNQHFLPHNKKKTKQNQAETLKIEVNLRYIMIDLQEAGLSLGKKPPRMNEATKNNIYLMLKNYKCLHKFHDETMQVYWNRKFKDLPIKKSEKFDCYDDEYYLSRIQYLNIYDIASLILNTSDKTIQEIWRKIKNQ